MTGKASVGEERKRKKDDKAYNLQTFMLKEECKSWHAQTMSQLLAPRLSVPGGRVPQQLCMGAVSDSRSKRLQVRRDFGVTQDT